ncbi:MAG: response regulator [Eubacteriales bacterium]|nr:response regulator [Eubacteriales bacterium]
MIKAVICDDERATRNIICHFLEEERLPIEIVGNAEDGEEAVALIRRTSPRLIFLDIHMPGRNGFQVIEEVSQEIGAQIIILTAFASFENAQQALRLGVCDILSKPVDMEQLKAAISRAIGWKFTTNETVNVMLEYIHAHYQEGLELEDLSRVTYSTESHLARLFKKYMGVTILSYVHRLRIEEACRLLASHECDIQETAFRVGYASLNNFYKYFKRYMGKTPAQFLE